MGIDTPTGDKGILCVPIGLWKTGSSGQGAAALVAALALVLSACAQPLPQGEPSSAKEPKIVSLNPCLDAILVEIADPAQILALSHYSRDPDASSMDIARARKFGVTGGTAEEVIVLDPDIVLASSFIAPSTRQAFERLEIEVETFGSPTRIEESVAQIVKLGKLSGNSDNASKLVAEIRAALSRDETGRAPPIRTALWQPGQIVPGDATLIAQLLERNGFALDSAQRGLGQAGHISLEAMLADPPELLLIAGASEGQTHSALKALSTTRVERLDPKMLYCGGPTIIAAQQRLEAIRDKGT